MDYKEKYEQALKRARKIHFETEFDYEKGMMEEIFPELKEKESEDERMRKALKQGFSYYGNSFTTFGGIKVEDIIAWLEKQDEKKSADEVMKIRQKFYSDGYMHGQDNIAIALGKESVEALEHFVRSIGESGYASPYDNRTKLVYRLLEQLKQIVK